MIGCGLTNSSEYKEEILAVADTKAEMTIDGMSCQVGCAAYIDEELEINESNQSLAEKKIDDMCKKLLANLIIEDYKINKI